MKNFITEETRKELRRLTRRYEKYGVSYRMLKKLVLNAPQEISEDMAIIGIRMMLGETYNETKYFSMSDVCKVGVIFSPVDFDELSAKEFVYA
ncbi:MAG: hypothetical protein K2M82_00255 [Lachnospiraceae bacterium]|nr:hypothetical protein [Lachnospiraceae bacterium]